MYAQPSIVLIEMSAINAHVAVLYTRDVLVFYLLLANYSSETFSTDVVREFLAI